MRVNTGLTLSLIVFQISADFHSSVIKLTQLVTTEARLKFLLDLYIEEQEMHIAELKEFQRSFRTQAVNNDNDLMNPLNLLELLNSLKQFKEVAIPGIMEKLKNAQIYEDFDLLEYPTEEDLNSMRLAIGRLQSTYEFPQEDIAKGKLFGVNYQGTLSSDDCHRIGLMVLEEHKLENAKGWFEVGLKIAKDNEKMDLMLSLIDVLIKQKRHGEAWKLTDEALSLNPNNTIATHYRLLLDGIFHENFTLPDYSRDLVDYFEELCKNFSFSSRTPTVTKLKCYFKTTTAFSRLAPFKAEEKYREPDIILFHDVLSDREISKLQGLAYNAMDRSAVLSYKNEHLQSKVRISQTAGLKNHRDKMIRRIEQRIEDMTGLFQRDKEVFQIANYGVGGVYYPHYDHLLVGDQNLPFADNRVATVIFYLDNVTYGGATAFPHLETAIVPIKGAAIFWLNTHPCGEFDVRTFHGACPVLLGTKWIATQWISEYAQTFHRLCSEPAPKNLVFTYEDLQKIK